MDQIQPSLRLLHCQTQAHVGCDTGPDLSRCVPLAVTHTHFHTRARASTRTQAHTYSETTGVTGLRTGRALYQRAKNKQTRWSFRTTAAVGVIPSDNGNLTPLGASPPLSTGHIRKGTRATHSSPAPELEPDTYCETPQHNKPRYATRAGGDQGAPSRRHHTHDPRNDLRDANMTFCHV